VIKNCKIYSNPNITYFPYTKTAKTEDYIWLAQVTWKKQPTACEAQLA